MKYCNSLYTHTHAVTHSLTQHFCLGEEDGRLASQDDSTAGEYLSGLRRCGLIYKGVWGQQTRQMPAAHWSQDVDGKCVIYTEVSHEEDTGIFSTAVRVILMRLSLLSNTEETMELIPFPTSSGIPGMLLSGI